MSHGAGFAAQAAVSAVHPLGGGHMLRSLVALGFAALLMPAAPASAAPHAPSSAGATVESFSECTPNEEGIKEHCENLRTVFQVSTSRSGNVVVVQNSRATFTNRLTDEQYGEARGHSVFVMREGESQVEILRGSSANLGCTVVLDLRMVNGEVIADSIQFIGCPGPVEPAG
jgi:hypothetical protein